MDRIYNPTIGYCVNNINGRYSLFDEHLTFSIDDFEYSKTMFGVRMNNVDFFDKIVNIKFLSDFSVIFICK